MKLLLVPIETSFEHNDTCINLEVINDRHELVPIIDYDTDEFECPETGETSEQDIILYNFPVLASCGSWDAPSHYAIFNVMYTYYVEERRLAYMGCHYDYGRSMAWEHGYLPYAPDGFEKMLMGTDEFNTFVETSIPEVINNPDAWKTLPY